MKASQRALIAAIALWTAATLPVDAAQWAAPAVLADASFATHSRSMSLAWSVGGAEFAFFGGDTTFATTVLGGADAGDRWGGLSLLPNDAIGPGVRVSVADDDARVTPVPEPQTGWLMLIGVAVLGLVLCRKG